MKLLILMLGSSMLTTRVGGFIVGYVLGHLVNLLEIIGARIIVKLFRK